MHCQFLGRTPLSTAERFLLTDFARYRSLGDEYLSAVLEEVGLTDEQATAIVADPSRASEQLVASFGQGPELTRTLTERGAASAMMDGIGRFGDAVARVSEPLRLDRCAIDDDGGDFEIAYYVPGNGIDVRDGDLFHAGVMLRGSLTHGTVTAAPRLVRQVCTNGQTQLTDVSGDACHFTCDVDGTLHGDPDLVVEIGLSRANLEAAAERMRDLQRRKCSDAIRALQQAGVRVPPAARLRVEHLFATGDDHSAYGYLNSITQAARDSNTIGERALLEAVAGQLVPALVRHTNTATLEL